MAVVLVMQSVHKCGLLRQKADEELLRMETTVGEPTDTNRVRIFMSEKQSGRKRKAEGRLLILKFILWLIH